MVTLGQVEAFDMRTLGLTYNHLHSPFPLLLPVRPSILGHYTHFCLAHQISHHHPPLGFTSEGQDRRLSCSSPLPVSQWRHYLWGVMWLESITSSIVKIMIWVSCQSELYLFWFGWITQMPIKIDPFSLHPSLAFINLTINTAHNRLEKLLAAWPAETETKHIASQK